TSWHLSTSPDLFCRRKEPAGYPTERGPAVQLRVGLGEPQLCQRRDCITPTDVRNNIQFEHRDGWQLDMMIFYLACCSLGTEVPLLPHDFAERLPAIRRPSQDVLLRAFSSGLQEIHPDPPQPLRMVEQKPDRLFSGLSGTPPRSFTGQ